MLDISAKEMKGHNILAVERFQDKPRHMIEFLDKSENSPYVVRHQTTDANGKFSKNEYIIYEIPKAEKTAEPLSDKPLSGNPTTGKPSTEKPLAENPTQLNTKKSNTEKLSTDRSNTDSIPFRENAAAAPPEANRREGNNAQQISGH